VIYLAWLVFFAGPNPSSIYRPSGVGTALIGIPEFVGHMLVGSWDAATPVPGFGIVVMTALVVGAIVALGRRPLRWRTVTLLGLLASGLGFAVLTAYSRVGTGLATATSSRYVYVILLATLPPVAYLLTLLVRDRLPRLLAVLALIATVVAYNAGQLSGAASAGAAFEGHTHALLSAALDLSDEHPNQIDGTIRPIPQPHSLRTLDQVAELEADYGMTRIPYDETVRLSALTNVGITLEPASAPGQPCETRLDEGTRFRVGNDGVLLRVVADGQFDLHATKDSAIGDTRTVLLDPGTFRLTSIEPLELVIDSTSVEVELCSTE
jgi:hypothetical protein